MSDGYIGIPVEIPGGKKLDTTELTVGANTVERERVVIAGAAATDIAPVSATVGVSTNPAKLDPTNDEVATGGSAGTTGGLTAHRKTSTGSINATVVKASPGRLYGITCLNGSGGIRFVKFYDKATTPSPSGGDLPTWPVGMVAGPSILPPQMFPHGLAFVNGISYVMVQGAGDTDETAVVANDLVLAVAYK